MPVNEPGPLHSTPFFSFFFAFFFFVEREKVILSSSLHLYKYKWRGESGGQIRKAKKSKKKERIIGHIYSMLTCLVIPGSHMFVSTRLYLHSSGRLL